MSDFARQAENEIASHYNAETDQFVFDFPEIPEVLPLALSDTIHSLRAALDYLIYELARKDSGSIQNGTQFPIETYKLHTTPNGNKIGFDTVVDCYLRGISQPHRDRIEDLQPYNGVKWTETLRDIFNPDKHRQLIPLQRSDVMVGWSRTNGRGKKLPTGHTIQIDPHQSIRINLPKGNVLIMSTLYTLHAHIHGTIRCFNSEF